MPAPKPKSIHANEDIKPADTPERRKFLAESAEQRRQEAAEAAARSAAAIARGKEKSAQRAKDAEMQRMQDERARQTQEAYDRAVKAPLAKGGSVKKYARGGGIESKGKTRGRMC